MGRPRLDSRFSQSSARERRWNGRPDLNLAHRLDLAGRLEFRPKALASERGCAFGRSQRKAGAIAEREAKLSRCRAKGASQSSLNSIEWNHVQLECANEAIGRRLVDPQLTSLPTTSE